MPEEGELSLEEVTKLEELFEQTGVAGIKQAREALRRAERKKYTDKGITLRSRLPNKYTDKLQLVIEYMHSRNYINKPTIYNFVKFSCEQVMGEMLRVISEEGVKSRIPKGRY